MPVGNQFFQRLFAQKLGPSAAPSKPTRALGTAYQPSTTRPTLVVIIVTPSAGTTQSAGVSLLMDAANPPTTEVGRAVIGQTGATTVNASLPLITLVPAGYYYKPNNIGLSPAVFETIEYTL